MVDLMPLDQRRARGPWRLVLPVLGSVVWFAFDERSLSVIALTATFRSSGGSDIVFVPSNRMRALCVRT